MGVIEVMTVTDEPVLTTGQALARSLDKALGFPLAANNSARPSLGRTRPDLKTRGVKLVLFIFQLIRSRRHPFGNRRLFP